MARDRRNQRALRAAGWQVLVVWECEVLRDPAGVLRWMRHELGLTTSALHDLPQRREILRVAEQRLQWGLEQIRSGAE